MDTYEYGWYHLTIIDNYGNDCWDSTHRKAAEYIVSTNTYGGCENLKLNGMETSHQQEI